MLVPSYKPLWDLLDAHGMPHKDLLRFISPAALKKLQHAEAVSIKPRLTPHFFRHNYVTMLYESGVDPLIAMKIVGHTDYQTTANIYTHVRDEMLKKATVNMNEVFQNRTED